nr:hypothetical protein Iba_chr04bCG13130 [Ipomoea batatas]
MVAAPPVNHPCAGWNFGEGGGKDVALASRHHELAEAKEIVGADPRRCYPKADIATTLRCFLLAEKRDGSYACRCCCVEPGVGTPFFVRRAGEDDGQVRAAETFRDCRAEEELPPCCCTSLAGRDRRRPSSLVLCLHIEAACERFHVEGYVAEKQRRGKKVKPPPGMEAPEVTTATVTTPCYCRDSWPELLLSKLGVAAAGNLRCCSATRLAGGDGVGIATERCGGGRARISGDVASDSYRRRREGSDGIAARSANDGWCREQGRTAAVSGPVAARWRRRNLKSRSAERRWQSSSLSGFGRLPLDCGRNRVR